MLFPFVQHCTVASLPTSPASDHTLSCEPTRGRPAVGRFAVGAGEATRCQFLEPRT